ncbi:transcription antitermination factor NusB [Erythrobacter sp.]|jgi:N utilization substance protein B|uniref:transcription antitermination factor NusB n=1 Tax=Erythrobacter sp. TaxID=1042 RepID=UPI002EBD6F9C|nr:transcription antitermination factor NusB [Erythrobacter sp.]
MNQPPLSSTRSNPGSNPRAQSRSAARLAAVQALYQRQMEKTPLARLLDEFHQHRIGREVDDEDHAGEVFADAEIEFFDDLVRGVDARLEEIDALLAARLAQGWTLARLDKTMLQILRAGTYELMARADVPKASAISEYVDVAKAFFDDREAKFANGILDAVAKEVRTGP